MTFELRKPQRPFRSTHATLRLALPSYANVPWIPFPGLIARALMPPDANALALHANVASMLGISSMADGWKSVCEDSAFAEVMLAKAGIVTTGDVICSITAREPWLVTEAIERISASFLSLSLLWSVADARENARRCAARASEPNTLAWSETSCIVRPHTEYHEAAGAIVLNQAPCTANGIVAIGSPHGRRITFASSVIDDVADIQSWHDSNVDTIWYANSISTFDNALERGDCVPVVPPERDVSYVMKHAQRKAPCGLRCTGKRYGFIASSASDAHHGFRSLVNVGMCPLEAIAVLDLDVTSPNLIVEHATAHPSHLIPLGDIAQLDCSAASKLMFS